MTPGYCRWLNPSQTTVQGKITAAIDQAICFGWIDGQLRGYDDQFFMLRFTPRRSGSKWSQVNRGTQQC